MTRTRHDEVLFQFFGICFNEDWTYQYSTEENAVWMFIRHSPAQVSETIFCLDKLIDQCASGKVDVDARLRELGNGYYYQADGITGLQWLLRVRGYFDKYKPPPPDKERRSGQDGTTMDPLDRFFSRYFTIDLLPHFGSAEGAVRAFAKREPDLVAQAIARIDEVISEGRSGKLDVDDYLTNKLQVLYHYQVRGVNGLQWLEELRTVFGEGAALTVEPRKHS